MPGVLAVIVASNPSVMVRIENTMPPLLWVSVLKRLKKRICVPVKKHQIRPIVMGLTITKALVGF